MLYTDLQCQKAIKSFFPLLDTRGKFERLPTRKVLEGTYK